MTIPFVRNAELLFDLEILGVHWFCSRPSAKQHYNLGKHVNDRDLAFLHWRERNG